MPASVALVALTLATWPGDPVGDGMARIRVGFATAEQAMSQVEEGTAKPTKVATLLGQLLGESRLRTGEVSEAIIDPRVKGDGMRLVTWSGTYEAYLSAAVLGLDGDDNSLALSRILGARLKREILRAAK